MKKGAVTVLLLAAIAMIALTFSGIGEAQDGSQTAYLRIHIRANSNSAQDQRVKYEVRDAIVEFLAPTVSECHGKSQAISAIEEKLSQIEGVAEGVLRQNGYFYGARAKMCEEQFPTRVYDGVTLEAGVYDALIVELGEGSGDNWWCVVYPPLCFTGGNVSVTYKSKIAEIIRSFFN